MLRLIAVGLLFLVTVGFVNAQGLPTQTWPAGTYLSDWPHGGRIVTYHNGYLYLGATDNQDATIYDISDPTAPQLMHNFQVGNNGHTWYKIGNAFWRAYWNPELGPSDVDDPFADLSDMLDWQPFTGTVYDFPFQSPPLTWPGNWLPTYPHFFGDAIYDAREGWWPPLVERDLQDEAGINAGNRWRLGNLLFFTPGDEQTGVAVFDIGDPTDPVLLDTLTGNYRQYTNAWQIWRNYLVLMNGDDLNGPDEDANTLVIDISDPSNLVLTDTIPYDDLPGRYAHFQDEYAFGGRFGRGTKFNMETMTVEQVFTPPAGGFGDFQWVPLGHLLLVSSSETNASHSFLFAHQGGLDTTPPSVGYHVPNDGAVNQPTTTVIGLVINEKLDSTTVNDQTIQIRPVGGSPIDGVVIDTNYDVVNFTPVDPLEADTTYEVRIVPGGIHDVAGNAVGEYVFHFSTGDDIGVGDPLVVGDIGFSPDTPVSVGAAVQMSVAASGGDGTLEYNWDFGDGSPGTGWGAGLDTTPHTFPGPGVFTVQVQVRDAGGQSAARTRRIVVEPQAAATLPTRSGSVVVDASGRRVWVVNPDHGTVATIDADTLNRLFEQPVCVDPRSVALDASARPWIACGGSNELLRLNPADGSVQAALDTGYGSAPEAVVIAPDGVTGYASLAGSGEILRFDPAAGAETDRLDAGSKPGALAVTGAGDRLLVARLVSDHDAGGSVLEIPLPAFVSHAEIDLPVDTTSPDSGTAGRGLPNYVAALAMSPDDSRLWYAAKKDNILRGMWREGSELTFETLVRVLVGSVDITDGSEMINRRIDLDDGNLALALAASAGGAHLFVALAGNHEVVAVDPWLGQEVQRLAVGFAPRGLAVDPVTDRLFVRNDLDRTVSVVDTADLVTTGSAGMSIIGTVTTADGEPLAADVLAGKRLFWDAADTRMGQDGYLSCASCHLDGGGDGRVWDFTQQGEGLRVTVPLNGRAGMSQGFVHWSANFDEIQDFEIQIRNLFAGTGYVDAADYHTNPLGPPFAGLSSELDDLAAYTTSLDAFGQSPHRNPDGSLTPSGAAGRQIFQDLECQTCHTGGHFTDSGDGVMHDVGTVEPSSGMRLGGPLNGLDTPTLRGLWNSAPYLHDGRADDLYAVLVDHNNAGAHGDTGSLTSQQLDDLVAFLRQIDDAESAMIDPGYTLAWANPADGSMFDENAEVDLVIDTDLPGISQVEFIAGGAVVDTLTGPPWQTSWQGGAGETWLQARVAHAAGTSLTRPVRVSFGLCSGQVGVLHEKWNGITGATVLDLTGHADYPDNPDEDMVVTDWFEGPTDVDDDYGARMSGWLCAPVTGEYTFWIASDDNGSLRLSTDSDPANAVEIAFHTSWTLPREWTKFASQQSNPVFLEEGSYYWIEALMKEDGGGDNLAVGWRLPDSTLERPMPADVVLRSPGAGPVPGDEIFVDGFEE